MPRFDGSGPRGQGPGTGRGRGYCRTGYGRGGGYDPGRGAGSGQGRGRRFQGRGYEPPTGNPTSVGYNPGIEARPARQPDVAELQAQEQMLIQGLRAIRERLAALEG
ncbi:MAG: DUF5320 domain-containing protein [Desulfobacteraceae bacterium]